MGMRGFLKVGLVAAVLVSMPVVAKAADPNPPYRGAPPVPLAYNWTGFYVGGHIGVGSDGDTGFLGGGQAGFNYQVNPQWVIGVEGQFSGTTIKDSVRATFFAPGVVGTAGADASLDWISTFAVRAGWTFDRWMVYGKVGGAWAHVSADAFAAVGSLSARVTADATSSGWMLGVGTEYALRDNWTVKIEYNMLDFGGDLDDKVHIVKAGLNYRFGFNPAPVYSRY